MRALLKLLPLLLLFGCSQEPRQAAHAGGSVSLRVQTQYGVSSSGRTGSPDGRIQPVGPMDQNLLR